MSIYLFCPSSRFSIILFICLNLYKTLDGLAITNIDVTLFSNGFTVAEVSITSIIVTPVYGCLFVCWYTASAGRGAGAGATVIDISERTISRVFCRPSSSD